MFVKSTHFKQVCQLLLSLIVGADWCNVVEFSANWCYLLPYVQIGAVWWNLVQFGATWGVGEPW